VISPAYAIFTNGVVLNGGEARAVPLTREGTRFHLDIDRVRRAVDGRTRMIIVNSPANPTGWLMTVDEQQALYELAERHDLMILADEVYERLVYNRSIAPSFARIPIGNEKDRLIVVNSFSKTYNMTGWRLGWAQGAEQVIRLMYRAVEFITSNPSAMVQQAGIVALRDGESYVEELRDRYSKRRAQVMNALAAIPGLTLPEPEGAFYAFPHIAGLADSAEFAANLVRQTGVALAPGAAFGSDGEGYVRLCFAASENTLSNALVRFREFMKA
jgi:aspartate aminotransferase